MNISGKHLNKTKVFDYDKEYESRRKSYLKSVSENNSFIRAELDFVATPFIDK